MNAKSKTPAKPLNMAVLISGGGTTLRNFLSLKSAGKLNVNIPLVISSNPKAKGIDFAKEANIPVQVIERKNFDTDQAYGDAVFNPCREAGTELVAMAGFLKLAPVPPDFANRVMNTHPALIPMFCGKGFYGLRVHQAVLDYGARVSGCTIHFVDNVYDHGPIILQCTIPVKEDDTPESLAARVFVEECRAYPEAIRLFAEGRLSVSGRRVCIAPPKA